MNEKQNLIYRIIEYGIHNEIIVKQKLIEALQISDIDEQYIENVLQVIFPEDVNPNHIMVRVSDSAAPTAPRTWQFRILPNAIFQYNDYLEIKAARESAEFARNQAERANAQATKAQRTAMIAIYISAILGVVQILLQIRAGS